MRRPAAVTARDQPAQRRPDREQVLLADDLVEGARAHPHRQARAPEPPHVGGRRTLVERLAVIRSDSHPVSPGGCGRSGARPRRWRVASTVAGGLPASVDAGLLPLRAAVIGVGAPVSGSWPPPVLGNAMTSRIESLRRTAAPRPVPAESDAAVRGWRRRRTRPAGTRTSPAPRPRPVPSSRRPVAARRGRGYGSTRRRSRCRCRPGRTRRTAPCSGSSSNRSTHSGFGDVKAWCTAVHARPRPRRRRWRSELARTGVLRRSRRTTRPTRRSAPTAARPPGARRRAVPGTTPPLPAPKNTQSPGLAPTWSARDHALGLGQVLGDRPASSPSSPTRTYASPRAPRCFAHSCHASRTLRGCDAPPGMTTAPTYGGLEHPERGVREVLRALDELQPEAQVGLVVEVTCHRVGVREPRDRERDVVPHQVASRALITASPTAMTSSWSTKLSSMSSWVNSGCRSARKSSSRKQRAIW